MPPLNPNSLFRAVVLLGALLLVLLGVSMAASADVGSAASAAAAAETEVATQAAASAVVLSEAPLMIEDGLVADLVARFPPLALGFLGIAAWRWLGFFVSFSVLFVLRGLVRRILRRLVLAVGKRTDPALADEVIAALNAPVGALLFALVAWVATTWLALSVESAHAVYVAWRLAAIVCVGWGFIRATDLMARGIAGIANRRASSSLDEHLIPLVARVGRILVFAVAVVLVLQELGYNVAGLIAGLGIGGLAVALAAQDTLGNWFGAATMYADRPFEIGDWIKSGEIEGIVEDIGLRSTRIRTFARTELSVPNKILASGTIENFSRMNARRVRFVLGLTYSTSGDQIHAVVEAIRALLVADERLEPDSVIVRFTDFGASSLDVMVQYFTLTTAMDEHLAIREQLGLAMIEILEQNGVSVAFPSQSIYIEQGPLPTLGEPPVVASAGPIESDDDNA